MADRSLARRYARAFIEIAQESGRTDALGEQLSGVLRAFRAHNDMLLGTFSNPVYTLTERGLAAFQRLQIVVDSLRDQTSKGLTQDQYETTLVALEQMAVNLGWQETPAP